MKSTAAVLLCFAVLGTGSVMGEPIPDYKGRVKMLNPDSNVQELLDNASPGDIFALAPGTYYKTWVIRNGGRPGAPVVLKAQVPGTVTISGAVPPSFGLAFRKVDGDLYQASVPWQVRWAMAGKRNLLWYQSLGDLKSLKIIGHDSKKPEPGPPEGFAWEDGTLYVRLLGGQNPNEAAIEIHRKEVEGTPIPHVYPRKSEYFPGPGTNITVGADYVILDGLRLHLAPNAAISIKGDHVTIRDCYIDGAKRGISANDSGNLLVEYCEFSGYPAYQWVRWGQEGGAKSKMALWNAVYNSNLNINFLNHYGPSVRFLHNIAYEGFDGLWPRDMGNLDPEKTSEYAYNLIMSCGDELIEFDTRKPLNLRVHHNFFMDATALLAISPVQGGGLTIDHNIVYVSPERGLKKSTLLKFDCPWKRHYDAATRDLTIAHNTFVNTFNTLYWTRHHFENSIFENNIVQVYRSVAWDLPGLTLSKHNLHSASRANPEHMADLLQAETPGFVVPPDFDAQALPVVPLSEAGLVETPEIRKGLAIDFRLKANSPAVDAGKPGKDSVYHHRSRGSAPDLGALELGDAWVFPRPGPRWAVGEMTPWRPPLPSSLDPKWVGLDK